MPANEIPLESEDDFKSIPEEDPMSSASSGDSMSEDEETSAEIPPEKIVLSCLRSSRNDHKPLAEQEDLPKCPMFIFLFVNQHNQRWLRPNRKQPLFKRTLNQTSIPMKIRSNFPQIPVIPAPQNGRNLNTQRNLNIRRNGEL